MIFCPHKRIKIANLRKIIEISESISVINIISKFSPQHSAEGASPKSESHHKREAVSAITFCSSPPRAPSCILPRGGSRPLSLTGGISRLNRVSRRKPHSPTQPPFFVQAPSFCEAPVSQFVLRKGVCASPVSHNWVAQF